MPTAPVKPAQQAAAATAPLSSRAQPAAPQRTADRMARRQAPRPIPPSEVLGRLFSLEAVMIVIAEAHLDRPEFDDAKRKQLIENMRANALTLAKQIGRPDLEIETAKWIDVFIADLVRNMPAMKGDLGRVEDQAAAEQ